MFRRLEASLPPDIVFPTDFEKLGLVLRCHTTTLNTSNSYSYYINEVGEIRKIAAPTEYFQYYISSNARVNEMHREAFNGKQKKPGYSNTYTEIRVSRMHSRDGSLEGVLLSCEAALSPSAHDRKATRACRTNLDNLSQIPAQQQACHCCR